MSAKVLITGVRAPVGVDLARSFKAAGYSVELADSSPAFAANMARLGPVLRLPPARFEFADFARELSEYCERNPGALIVPTCEEVFFVSAASERHGFANQVLTSDLEVLRRLHSKIEFPALLQELRLPSPRTQMIDSPLQDLKNADVVLKPEFSRFGRATLIKPSVRQLATIQPSKTSRWALQEFIAGDEFCLWSVARGGELVASVVYRPKWRQGQTAAYAFEATEAPDAIDIARDIAKGLNYTGQIALDLIRAKNGQYIPIECNPRAVSGAHLFDCRADLAKAMAGKGPPVHVTSGLRYLAPAMLLMGWPKSLLEGRTAEWRADMKRGEDALVKEVLLGTLLDAGRFALLALANGGSPSGQTTDDIEWNGEPLP